MRPRGKREQAEVLGVRFLSGEIKAPPDKPFISGRDRLMLDEAAERRAADAAARDAERERRELRSIQRDLEQVERILASAATPRRSAFMKLPGSMLSGPPVEFVSDPRRRPPKPKAKK